VAKVERLLGGFVRDETSKLVRASSS